MPQKNVIIAFTVLFVLHCSCALPLFAEEPSLPAPAQELTPLGAIRAGNADGSIPPWTGGITALPADYQPGQYLPHPYPEEKPLFVITAAEAGKYNARLAPGHQALLKNYLDYKLPIYPSHRSASFPQHVYEALAANARQAHLTGDGNNITGAAVTVPFPQPKNGLEAIWNHLLRYRGEGVRRTVSQAAVTTSGNYTPTKILEELFSPYAVRGAKIEDLDNILIYVKQEISAPPKLAGTNVLVHETLDKNKEPRSSWIYYAGDRRVRRAPFIAYDSPAPSSDGLRTFDQYDMYNGATDRYDWKLAGRTELYVPYNAYQLQSTGVKLAGLVLPLHMNQDLARYELHRVWKVEATLKEGARHIYARRVFYLDEDSWQALLVENYDKRGNLWRFSEGHAMNYYQVPTVWTAAEVHYDLDARRYLLMEVQLENPPYDFSPKYSAGDFTPSALRRSGLR